MASHLMQLKQIVVFQSRRWAVSLFCLRGMEQ